jgi:hypothetical protein
MALRTWCIPVPQVPVANSNGSQGLNRSSPLTHSLTHQSTHSTSLKSTALTELNPVGRVTKYRRGPHRKHRFQHYFIVASWPLRINGRCLIFLYRGRCLATDLYVTILYTVKAVTWSFHSRYIECTECFGSGSSCWFMLPLQLQWLGLPAFLTALENRVLYCRRNGPRIMPTI